MPSARDPDFPTTHWTLVNIVKGQDPRQAALALEEICARYWYPIYAYLRRDGHGAEDAEDLTQMLFHRLVAEDVLQQVQKERGRLRSFLIGMLRRVIRQQARHEGAEKRGGGADLVTLDEAVADERYTEEPLLDTLDPERLYDRAWAMQLLETVRQTLHAAFIRTGRDHEYAVLEPFLGWEDDPAPLAELAVKMNSTENAVGVQVHRLRKKFRELLEAEVARTVANPEDIAGEMEWIREVLRK